MSPSAPGAGGGSSPGGGGSGSPVSAGDQERTCEKSTVPPENVVEPKDTATPETRQHLSKNTCGTCSRPAPSARSEHDPTGESSVGSLDNADWESRLSIGDLSAVPPSRSPPRPGNEGIA